MRKPLSAIVFALALAVVAWPAQKPAAKSPQSSARRAPQAKTQPEFKDYNTANAVTGGAAMEKAAADFAAKYPESELRSFLFSRAMHEYQLENNPDKILAMGQKVLELDPDNSIALVLTATVLSDQMSPTGLDRQEKMAAIKKNAARALQTLDADFVPPPTATPEQVAAYKNMMRAMAHSALGIMNLKVQDDATAETELKLAADLGKAQPDPYVWYHLALAQDHQKKYTEALSSVEQALSHMGNNADLGKLAEGERTRLQTLTRQGSPAAQQPPANNSQPPR